MEKNNKELFRVIKFALFSISAGVIQIIFYTLLFEVAGLAEWASYLIALVLSVVWNFTFNRKFTFKSATNVPVAMIKVAGFYAVFTPLSTLLEYYLTDVLGWIGYIATVINMLINFVSEFFYQRYFVFGKSIDTSVGLSERDKDLVERAKNTLFSNVYEDNGYPWSPYKCITPGKNHFKGIWNWDNAFHAVGMARYDTDIAKDNILGFFKFQRQDGLLPDLIYENGEIIDLYQKPPVFAFATETVYKKCKDKEFLKVVYPKLKLNHEYWDKNRLYNGMYFYDSDGKERKDYIQLVKYESGWDNSVRWDNGIVEYWAIDLNCFMALAFRSLKFIAKELGLKADVTYWDNREKELSALIINNCFDQKNGYFADVNRYTGEISTALSPASFMPLYIGIATKEQADAMNKIAVEKFESKMPTTPYCDKEYSNDYWRGPTWLNVAYFAGKGLKDYGYKVAEDIKEWILNACYQNKDGIYENYDSVSGKGLCCDHFSWSSVFILEFIYNW